MFKKAIISISLLSCSLFGAINIDSKKASIELVEYRGNILVFPFLVEDAKIATSKQDNYELIPKKNTVTIIPKVEDAEGDLIIWTGNEDTFIINISNGGDKQLFEFTYNGESGFRNSKVAGYETGKIDADIKKIIKEIKTKDKISGYAKIRIKRKFVTPTMLMQKDYIHDGGKYRVEEWYIQNKTKSPLFLDEATFYSKGIIAIDFEQRELKPRETTKMIIIVNKASLVKE